MVTNVDKITFVAQWCMKSWYPINVKQITNNYEFLLVGVLELAPFKQKLVFLVKDMKV
jgi:hypothetical protein